MASSLVDKIRTGIKTLSHYTSKPVNSNAAGVGIRLSGEPLSIPYICVSTVGPKKVPVDICAGGAAACVTPKYINTVQHKYQYKDFTPDPRALKEASKQLPLDAAEYNTDEIDPRLRQLLWPTNNGNYVALTPLHSTGLSRVINDQCEKVSVRVKKQKEEDGHGGGWWFQTAFLDVGGSNKQNVGLLARALCHPLQFDAPSEDAVLKQAYSYYYNGVRLTSARRAVDEYAKWRVSLRQPHVSNSMYTRLQADRLIRRVAFDVLHEADRATDLLVKHEFDLNEDLSPVQQGLLNKPLRDTEWRNAFGDEVARYIVNYKPLVNGERIGLGLSDDEIGVIRRLIQECT